MPSLTRHLLAVRSLFTPLVVMPLFSCALITGHAQLIPTDDYLRSDVYMQERGFTVMTAGAPALPAQFGREIRRVYVTGSGPRVILLHEMPGLRPEDVE